MNKPILILNALSNDVVRKPFFVVVEEIGIGNWKVISWLRMAPANRDKVNNNFGEITRDDFDDGIHRPLKHGCDDNWTWSKKNRSKEVVLPEPSLRKGK